MKLSQINIGGEMVSCEDINDVGDLPMVEDGRCEWYVAENSEEAGKVVRARWVEMAENDPSEFRAMVGDECLINWCLGRCDGPGNGKVRSLEEWFDLTADHPEEDLASYDGEEQGVDGFTFSDDDGENEREVSIGKLTEEERGIVVDALGFVPSVAYRHN